MASRLADFPAPRGLVDLMTQGVKVALVGVLAVLIVVGGAKYFAHVRHSAVEAEGVGQQVGITISKKDNASTVAQKLHQAGLIHSELYFTSMLKVKNAVLVPGSYTLPKGLSVSELITLIAH